MDEFGPSHISEPEFEFEATKVTQFRIRSSSLKWSSARLRLPMDDHLPREAHMASQRFWHWIVVEWTKVPTTHNPERQKNIPTMNSINIAAWLIKTNARCWYAPD